MRADVHQKLFLSCVILSSCCCFFMTWKRGSLRKRAAFDVRSAIRRKRREEYWAQRFTGSQEIGDMPVPAFGRIRRSL